ncbi:hypothetical protein K435DRAFT_743149 [Dendrothele bispora CBS 962.96]|uniref:Uncharacterized protein n=1 Tax=Dendrothele bispora (strain CBS 962.96) TaxID=1314807 RepID=A0A4S8MW54_DENBC|nr:hypothetical protein K435DRAFT_743149 [Dendrothele bispora CBS 962.96]
MPSMTSVNYYTFIPDDQTEKDVYLQAHGTKFDGRERHVVIHWKNGTLGDSPVTQLVQLSGIRGKYAYDSLTPMAKIRNSATMDSHTQYYLGSFSREERQILLQLAGNVEYESTSTINGCRVWMRDLLSAMVGRDLISEETFDDIAENVPLPERRDE